MWMWMSLAMLAGCTSGGAAIQYYLIDPVDQPALQIESGLRIQITDLHIPQYLQRFQIARRSGDNQLTFSDSHQWGENLRKNLLRTLSRNISTLLDTADVSTPINRSSSTPDYRVKIVIEQFDQDDTRQVVLAGRYQISSGPGTNVLDTKTFEFVGLSASGNYSEMLISMQELFNNLCLDVTETIILLDSR
jgi:uncharacterized lipoprotein YmbA